MGDRNKKTRLQIASSAPWQKAKTDSPNQGILLNADDIRWELHQADKLKTAELKLKEYLQRLIKNNTKTTWRTYAADAMHGIGEGLMMLNPYTTVSYFGGKALDSATKGDAVGAVTNAGFASMPWAGKFVPKLVNLVESTGKGINKGMQVLNSPLTGRWTQFGNKEVRLAPGYVGMNASPFQVRPTLFTESTSIDGALGVGYNALMQDVERGLGRTPTHEELELFARQHPDLYVTGDTRYPALRRTRDGALLEALRDANTAIASKNPGGLPLTWINDPTTVPRNNTRYTGIDDLLDLNTVVTPTGTRVAGQHLLVGALNSDLRDVVERIPNDEGFIFSRGSSRLPGVQGVISETEPGSMRRLLERNLEALVSKGVIPGEPILADPNAPYRNIDDLIENNTLELEGNRRTVGVRGAARELRVGSPLELIGSILPNSPIIGTSPVPGTFMLEEARPGGFRTVLEEKQPQLMQRGVIRERVTPKPTDATLSLLRGLIVKATDPRVADVPREELAKYGIGLDMSEGGTPYKFSDMFISPSDPVYGVTLSDFASKDPGAYNTAYWYHPGHPGIINVSRYYGAKLNRQALADEGRRIQLNNPINVSGSFGALKDFDLNVLSYLNAMRNMLKLLKIGRQIHLIDPKLNPHNTEFDSYIRMNDLYQGPRYDDSQVSPEFVEAMRDMFNQGEKAVSSAVGRAPEGGKALSDFLEKKAGLRSGMLYNHGSSRIVNPSKFSAEKMFDAEKFAGYKLKLDGKDAGFLRAVPKEEIFDGFMSQFDLLRSQLGLKLKDPKLIGGDVMLGPKLTTMTFKKGGNLKQKLIKRCR